MNSKKQDGSKSNADVALDSLPPNLEPIPSTEKSEILRRLTKDRFAIIAPPLSDQEKSELKKLHIAVEGNAGNFLYWGNVNSSSFSDYIVNYFNTLGQNSELVVHTLHRSVCALTKQVTAYFDTEFAWVETKTFLPNETFIIPRWHTDNKFFTPHTAYKLVWSPKGPQTRIGTTTQMNEFGRLTALEIEAGHGTEGNLRARKELDALVAEYAIRGNVAILYQSGGTAPVVHSEPNINESRLFVAIVPGSIEEIRLWHERKAQKDERKGVANRPWSYNLL